MTDLMTALNSSLRARRRDRSPRSPRSDVSTTTDTCTSTGSLSPRSLANSLNASLSETRRRRPGGPHPPRASLYVRRYVELDAFRRENQRGSYKNLSRDEKIKRFGSHIVPIPVPLAPGETKDQYEARFRGWLGGLGLALDDLERDPDENRERFYWFKFASENSQGKVKFVPPATTQRPRDSEDQAESQKMKRPRKVESPERDQSEPQLKKTDRSIETSFSKEPPRNTDAMEAKARPAFSCQLKPPPQDSPVTAFTAAYSACGCRQCLVRGMQHLAAVIAEVQTTRSTKDWTGESPSSVIDLTDEEERSSPIKPASPSARERSDAADIVEMQLLEAYNEINEMVVMNERVLEAEKTRLANEPVTDIHEMARLHEENLELQEIICGEIGPRSVALAILIVYMWRHEVPHLKQMTNDSTALDVDHIQRAIHARCAELASTLADKHEFITTLNQQIKLHSNDATPSRLTATTQRLKEMLTRAESDVHELTKQRRRHFEKAVFFDAELRRLIRVLLAKAESEV